MTTIHDSGTRQQFDTGAVRDTSEGKPRLGLISPIFEQRLAAWLTEGARKYDARNWEKGIPMERTMESLLRHINAYREGRREEDHLAAAACNVMFLIHTEVMCERGLLPAELAAMPSCTADMLEEPEAKAEPEVKADAVQSRDCDTCKYASVGGSDPPCAECQVIRVTGNFSHWEPKA